MGRAETRKMAKKNGLDQKALTHALHVAQDETRKKVVYLYTVAVLSVLADKFGFDHDKLQNASGEIQERFDSVLKDYASLQDFERVLLEEYDIKIVEKSDGKKS